MDWIKISDRLPEKEGRYFIMTTFYSPVISGDSIVRKNVLMTSNFSFKKGFLAQIDDFIVTHWMEKGRHPYKPTGVYV